MPNYLIPISDVCYNEFQNVKSLLKINPDVLSDSEILRMIFEKIDSNKDFIKEMQAIGKSSRGRTIPIRNKIKDHNFEDLAKCPGCEHSICMLKQSLNEMVRIEMHAHFDTCHKKAGFFQCHCKSTFDWMPAYLRHISVCTFRDDQSNESVLYSESNSSSTVPPEPTQQASSEYQGPLKRNKRYSQLPEISEDANIFKHSPPKKTKFNLFICPNCLSSFQTQAEHTCMTSTTTTTPNTMPSLTSQPSKALNLESIPWREVKFEESVPTITDTIIADPRPTVFFTCYCRQTFNDYIEYNIHTTTCSEKPTQDPFRDNSSQQEISRSASKSILKECVPDSDGNIQCPKCPKSFKSQVSLKQHFAGKHQTDSRKKCPKCDKSFSWSTSYKSHLNSCKA